MKALSKLFATPARTAVTLCVLLALLTAATVGIASAVTKGNVIGNENALNVALADAGVAPLAAEATSVDLDREDGRTVYEVSFAADGFHYEYEILAETGVILKKEVEPVTEAETGAAPLTATLSLEQATNLALQDAEQTAAGVTILRQRLEADDGRAVYEIDFSTAAQAFEYEIDAQTGAVLTKEIKLIATGQVASSPTAPTGSAASAIAPAPSTPAASTPVASGSVAVASTPVASAPAASSKAASKAASSAASGLTLEQAKAKALADAGVKAADAAFTEQKQDYDDGRAVYEFTFSTASTRYEYEIARANGQILKRESTALTTASVASTGGADIGVDKAKSIALQQAGLSASQVRFEKAKRDREDGRTVYEVEFVDKNRVSYEYVIDAQTGAILESDIDRDD